MNTKVFKLAFMAFWLSICLGIALRDWWMPDEMREKIGDQRARMLMLLTGAFAIWNLAKLMASNRSSALDRPSPEVLEYRRRIRTITGADPKVTDPQFNFEANPPDAPPHGDHS